MSLRLAMLEASLASQELLGDAYDSVVNFIRGEQNPDGGWRGRGKKSDIYYTAFGSGALQSLGQDIPANLADYLQSLGTGDDMDFVHLACLARCWANCPHAEAPLDTRQVIYDRLQSYQAEDGGYHIDKGRKQGSAYGCFLALGAFEDLDLGMPDAERMVLNMNNMLTPDGGYANEAGQKVGVTTLTSGVLALQRNFNLPINHSAGEWLLKRLHPLGGFQASPAVPVPDLLSTATAMQALNFVECECNEAEIRNRCLHFLDGVWDEERGAFCGHAFDRKVDVEYTWYGLLALGHLVDPPDEDGENTDSPEPSQASEAAS